MSTIQDLNSAGQSVLAGLATFAANAVVHPLCTIKNRVMANEPPFPTSHGGLGKTRILYAGYLSCCATESTCYAASYIVKDYLEKNQYSCFASSILAGIASSPLVSFGESIMVNQQVNNRSILQSMRSGARISGLVATIFREVPYTVAVFSGAPLIQEHLPFSNELMNQIVGGSVAGALAGAVTAPVDKIKTLVQTNERLCFAEAITIVAQETTTPMGRRSLLTACGTRSAYIGLAISAFNLLNNQLPPLFPNYLKEE